MRLLHEARTLPYLAAAVAALALLAAAPAGAATQRCEAPPGTAAIDQYCEAIPSPGGSSSPGHGGSGGRGALPSKAQGALSRAGTDGAGLLRLVQETGRGGHPKGRTAPKGTGSTAGVSAHGRSNNPLSAVRSAAQSGATLSPAFPLALLGLALLALAFSWTRYRSRQRQGA